MADTDYLARMKPTSLLVLFIGPVLLLSGCATSTLWQTGQFANFHEPATPPNLSLFKSSHPNDVLVEYDESRENDDFIRRRAYWLERNTGRVRDRQKPRFVSVDHGNDLIPIPLANSPPSTTPAGDGLCAVASTNGQSFALYSIDQEKGPYQLPVYADASGRTKQVLLTPITVAADLTIIGGYLFVYAWQIGALGWLH